MKHYLKRFVSQVPRPWLIAWAIIYAIILIANTFVPIKPLSGTITVFAILLCFVYAVHTSPKDYLLVAALAATVVADFVLDFNNTSPVGLVVFVIAQTIHLFRTTAKKYHKILLTFIIVATIIIATCFITEFAPPHFRNLCRLRCHHYLQYLGLLALAPGQSKKSSSRLSHLWLHSLCLLRPLDRNFLSLTHRRPASLPLRNCQLPGLVFLLSFADSYLEQRKVCYNEYS